MDTRSAVSPPRAAPRRGAVRSYRVVVGVLVGLVAVQALLAGQLLAGSAAMRTVHGVNGDLVMLVGLVHLVTAVGLWRPGRGPGWIPPTAAVLLLAIGAQVGTGWTGVVAVHVPLGVAIFGTAVALLVTALRLPTAPTDPSTSPVHPSDRSHP